MAAFTSAASGNWNDGATWGGASPGTAGVDYPGAGDSATITTHTVTVPTSTTSACGTAPDNLTTYDLVISSTGQLIINGTLNLTSNFDVTGGGVVTVSQSSGGTLNFDPSARPTTKRYRWRLGNTGTGKLVMGPGGHITAPSGCEWYMESTNPTANTGQLLVAGSAANFVRFTRMRNSADSASSNYRAWYIRGTINATGVFGIAYLICDECDHFNLSFSGSWTCTIDHLIFINTVRTTKGPLIRTEATVQINVSNSYFDLNVNGSGAVGANGVTMKFSECYLKAFTNSGSASWQTDQGYNFKDQTLTGTDGPAPFQPATGTTVTDRSILFKEPYNNPHWLSLDGSSTRTMTVQGMIYELDGAQSNGERITPSPGVGGVQRYNHCLFIPGTDGSDGGAWLSQGGDAVGVGNISGEHWTGYAGDPANPASITKSIYFGETYNSQTGRMQYIRRSSFRDAPAQAASADFFVVALESLQTSNDPIVSAACTYNKIDAANHSSVATVFDAVGAGGGTQSAPPSTGWVFSATDCIDVTRRAVSAAAWFGARIGATGDSTTAAGTAGTRTNLRLLLLECKNGTYTGTDADKICELIYQWVARGHIDRSLDARGACDDGLSYGQWGGWLPTLSSPSATASSGSVTTNIADGTIYWVLTTSSTGPDYDRVLAAKDHTGATVASGLSGNQAVSSTGAQSIDLSGATLSAGTDYYLHVVHRAEGSEAGLDDYLRTSETVSSAAFQSAAGGGNRFPAAFVRKLRIRRAA